VGSPRPPNYKEVEALRKLFVGALLLAGLAAFAGTCTLQHYQLTQIGSYDTYGGEIHNDTGANFLGHNVVVAFVDPSGVVVDTKTVTPCLRSLQDGAATFFSVQSGELAANTSIGLARLEYGSSLKLGTAVTGNVSLSNVVITRNGTSLHVRGTIRNNDTTTLTNPNVCAVVYTSAGNVVVVGQDTGIVSLSQNASDTFDILVTVPNSTTTVDHIDLWADGFENDVPIVPESVLGRSVSICNATATATPTGSATATFTPTTTASPTSTATPTNTPGAGTPTVTNTSVPVATATSICN
jgi:hypothetical protein